ARVVQRRSARSCLEEWRCQGIPDPPLLGTRGDSRDYGEEGWNGQGVPDAWGLFCQLLQKPLSKPELLTRTTPPITRSRMTTRPKPHPIRTAGNAMLLRRG